MLTQREGEDPFKYIDRLQREWNTTELQVNAMKGWRFKGRKPNGDWLARHGYGEEMVEVRQPTSEALVEAILALHCPECRHFVSKRVPTYGCRGFREVDGEKKRCECITCVANAPKAKEAGQ